MRAYSTAEASAFVARNAALPVQGAPIEVPGAWFLSDYVRTLGDFARLKYPPYGVIVKPTGGEQILVWYDATGALHVIDVTGESIAREVPKAPYHTADESFINNLLQRIDEMAKGLPKPGDAITAGLSALALVALIMVLKK